MSFSGLNFWVVPASLNSGIFRVQRASCNWQVMKISDILRALENAGEVGLEIALHSIKDDGKVVRNKPCCFVLDAPKEKTKDKKATCQIMRLSQMIACCPLSFGVFRLDSAANVQAPKRIQKELLSKPLYLGHHHFIEINLLINPWTSKWTNKCYN